MRLQKAITRFVSVRFVSFFFVRKNYFLNIYSNHFTFFEFAKVRAFIIKLYLKTIVMLEIRFIHAYYTLSMLHKKKKKCGNVPFSKNEKRNVFLIKYQLTKFV